MNTQLFTVNEVAERVRVNPRTVRRWITEGKLRAARVMGSIRIESREVDEMVKTDSRSAQKSVPDRKALMEEIEQMLADDPYPSSSESITAILRDVRKGREDEFQHRY